MSRIVASGIAEGFPVAGHCFEIERTGTWPKTSVVRDVSIFPVSSGHARFVPRGSTVIPSPLR